ncbi:MAG: glycerophosphodiester phosphodiesterase family protein [Hyphomonadaceae bacterium]|nr:glycerophosphodiester phosphodiesterase family protein [Hyphomonadaceae bacterium]
MKRLALAAALMLAACGPAPDDALVNVGDDGRPGERAVVAPSNLAGFFDCLRDADATAISAHRGGPAPGFAENAIPTFENTLRQAPGSFLEVDISQTADGVLVLMHDDRVERTTTGTGAVAELDMADLLRFTLEDDDGERVDARVPTLREALDWADGRTVLELDIKRGVRFEDVISEVEAAGAMSRVVFVTYSVDGAARLARLAPQAMIYTTISNLRELETLTRRDVDLTRIVAWLGTNTPDAGLVEALAERGVEARIGMFGDGRDYSNAPNASVQIVAVDDAREAYRDLDAADGVPGFAASQCALG